MRRFRELGWIEGGTIAIESPQLFVRHFLRPPVLMDGVPPSSAIRRNTVWRFDAAESAPSTVSNPLKLTTSIRS
jgi:hypothetical protein